MTTSSAAATLGSIGGRAGTGKAKARTRKQAQAAANARWGKRSPARSVRPLPGFTPTIPGGLSLSMLRDVARDLPGITDAWRLAEAGRLLAQAADELERLRR